jgi:hypothetical protein
MLRYIWFVIVVSDSVTYTVTAVLMARMKVDYHGQDTETVVIAVAVGDINLALGKPATESSTYTYSIPVAAGYAVDGNTIKPQQIKTTI